MVGKVVYLHATGRTRFIGIAKVVGLKRVLTYVGVLVGRVVLDCADVFFIGAFHYDINRIAWKHFIYNVIYIN